MTYFLYLARKQRLIFFCKNDHFLILEQPVLFDVKMCCSTTPWNGHNYGIWLVANLRYWEPTLYLPKYWHKCSAHPVKQFCPSCLLIWFHFQIYFRWFLHWFVALFISDGFSWLSDGFTFQMIFRCFLKIEMVSDDFQIQMIFRWKKTCPSNEVLWVFVSHILLEKINKI